MKQNSKQLKYKWLIYALAFMILAGPQLNHYKFARVAYAQVSTSFAGVVADDVNEQCDVNIEQAGNGVGVWSPKVVEKTGYDADSMKESQMTPEYYLDRWNPGPNEAMSALISDVGQLYEVNCVTTGGTNSGQAGIANVKDARPWLDHVQYDPNTDTTNVQIAYPTTMIITDTVNAHTAMWYNPAGAQPELHSIQAIREDRDNDGIADTTVVQFRWKGDHAANFSFLTRYSGTHGAFYGMWQRNDMVLQDGVTLDTSTWGESNRNAGMMPAFEDGEQLAFNAATIADTPTGQINQLFLPLLTNSANMNPAVGTTIPQQ